MSVRVLLSRQANALMKTHSSFWSSLDSFDDSELAESESERRAFDAHIRESLGTKQDHIEESIEETPAKPLTRAQVARRIGEKSRLFVSDTIENFALGTIQLEGSVVITNPISNVSTPLRSDILVAASPAITSYNTRSSTISATQVLSPQDALPPLRRPRTLETPFHVDSPLASTGRLSSAASPTPTAHMPLRKTSRGSSLQPLSAHHALVAEAIKEKPRIKGISTGPLSGMVFFFPGLEERVAKRKIDKQKAKLWYGVILEAAGQIAPDFTPEAGVTHIVWEDESRTVLCSHLGLESLEELPGTTCVIKTSFISECKREKCQRPIAPHLSFPPAKVRERRLVPLNTTGVVSRTVDITYQFRATSSSRRRSISEESTDSLRHKTTRTMSPGEIQQIADGLIPEQQSSNITSAVATSHQAASGPGWERQKSPSKADGLDIMIAGLVKGTLKDVESDYGSETENETDSADRSAKRRKLIADGKEKLNQDARDAGGVYKCMQKNDGQAPGSSDGPNEFIAKKLDEMHELYEAAIGKNQFSKQAYRKGIMRRTVIPIRTKAEALELKGIGDSLATRIEEISTNNPFGRAYYEDTAQSRIVQLFKGIYGVGATRAHELYEMGARSLDDLRTGRYGLTHGQEIGLHLYHDLQQRIPRAECQALFNQVQSLVHKIDPKIEVEIMGSYRRGANDSGDVDILLTRDDSDGKTHAGALPTLLQWLFRKRIFTHSLSEPTDGNALEAKWMGVAVADPDDPKRIHRRVDILCIPFEQRGAALIYFTGNDIFNRSLRLYARKNGYSLNQRGLYKGVIRNRVNQQKETEGVLVASKTEQEIFDVLGIRWRPPHHRRP